MTNSVLGYLKNSFNTLVGEDVNPRPVVKLSERKALYETLPSFVGHLPWVEYSHKDKSYRFEDGFSVAAGYDVTPFDADGKSGDFILNRRTNLLNVLHSIPDDSESPWVLQCFLQGSPLTFLKDLIHSTVDDRAKGSVLTEYYTKELAEHIDQISQAGGIFSDKGANWRGKQNKSRLFLYRRAQKKDFPKRGIKRPEDELKKVSGAFEQQMKFAKVDFKRTNSEDLYNWMLPFFNPGSAEKAGGAEGLIKQQPYPLQAEQEGDLPLGFDLATACFMSAPKSIDEHLGVFAFQGYFYKYITLGPLIESPAVGHLTLPIDSEKPSLYDMMPDDTLIAMTITINNQQELKNKTVKMADDRVGEDESAIKAKLQAQEATLLLNNGSKGFRLNMGVYVRGEDMDTLMENVEYVSQTLRSFKLNPVDADDDVLSQNNFMINMPMAYEPGHVTQDYSSHLTYSHHIANLLPVWGRGRGTGHLGFLFWNRSGEPLMFNPFHKKDRRRAAHGLILGPTGSGKSALICYLVEMLMAFFRPRIFIIEVGNSFGLLSKHLKAKGCSVNHVRISVQEESSGLSPFSDAVRLLDTATEDLSTFQSVRELEQLIARIYGEASTDMAEVLEDAAKAVDPQAGEEDDDDDDDEERDLIGELELAAMIMITGGEEEEVKRYTRADRNMVRTAIFLAAQQVKSAYKDKKQSHDQVLATNIAEALHTISQDKSLPEERKLRAFNMYQSLNLFNQGLESKFFNRPGKPWALADVTVVDLDRFARKGSEDKLAVLMTGLLNRINDIAEASQNDGRPIIVIIDEAHIVTVNPLLGPYIATIGKMWRKLKTWLWLATQNMKDFPEQASKMLSMAEFWLCLNPDEKEIDEISRFKSLSADETALLRAATKEPGKFIEGVVISEVLTTLFRNVPPARSLALAGTEGDEKAAREKLMTEHGISELEAIDYITKEIFKSREQHRKGFVV